jgi:class 3 adenylate cyclase
MRPETHWAKAGDIHVAYQVMGDGPIDLVLVAEFWHSIEAQWDEPSFARFLERLSGIGRLICFDQRGSGVSDPVAIETLSLEQWMDDVRVVMDAVASERAALLGIAGGGMLSALYAATYPQRTSALVLMNSFARMTRAPDFELGRPPDFEQEVLDLMAVGWGHGVFLERMAPSKVGDEAFRQWWARYQRLGASPGTILKMRQTLGEVDVRDVLPTISVPTLVLHRAANIWIRPENGRFLAENIEGARYVELEGNDYFVFLGDTDALLGEIEAFLGATRPPDEHRVLATVLFTDIVDSTRRAAELGDAGWAKLLQEHHAVVRRQLELHRGREVDTAGDGFFATFDGPARAVRCACAVRDAVRDVGLEIRAGVHTGELELQDGAVRGLAVHLGQRVAAEAQPGEVLVSSTVRDLVGGSGIAFEDRGEHALKGVPEPWRLFAVRGDLS